MIYLCYVKTTLRDKDAELFEQELEYFRKFYPEHLGKKLIGILASMNYSETLLIEFEKKGLIYMAPSGYSLTIKNTKEFKPKIWNI
ncbi:MAG: hypothetical protein N3A69_16505 [Leptospiraceae bacterium]|nr:hypothetical protein [Leptospiraceae bacterium]